MRSFLFFLVAAVVLAGVFWMVRPAALGDAHGLYALVDSYVPAAATWREGYLKATGQPVAANPAPAAAAPAASAAKAKPSVVVTTVAAETRSLDLTFEGLGTVQSMASVVIKPRVDSQVLEVPVAEGANVKVGDLLFKLDDGALRAQLATSEAQIAKDKAMLEQNQHDLARNQDLLKQKFVAPQIVETSQTTVNQTQAQIGVDEGQRDAIKRQIGYMEIRSTVNGRIGSIAAKPGAAVKSGDTLATVNQIDPIYVSFAVPQDRLGDLRAAMASGKAKVSLRDNPKAPTGSIAFIENAVDTTTGTVLVKATMPNPTETLWPGAFANVVLVTGTEPDALTVPSDAVQVGQKGSFVFVAKDGKALLRLIKIERVAGDLTVVKSGVEAGDQVVVTGQMGLSDGAPIAMGKPAGNDNGGKTTSEKTASQG